MSGKSATDDQIIRQQQERDLGHGLEGSSHADRIRAGIAGATTTGDDYPHERDESIEERRRRLVRRETGVEDTRGKPRA